LPGLFFVACVSDGYRQVVQRADLLQSLKRVNNDDVSRLHVVHAWTLCDVTVTNVGLKRVVGLKYCVEVSDQQ
jgi:hypothetical protein